MVRRAVSDIKRSERPWGPPSVHQKVLGRFPSGKGDRDVKLTARGAIYNHSHTMSSIRGSYLHIYITRAVTVNPKLYRMQISKIWTSHSPVYLARTISDADHSGRAVWSMNRLRSLEHWDHGFEWVSVCVYSVSELLCVYVAALRLTDPPSKGSYRLCMGLRKWKSSKGPTKRNVEACI
jgi:hypothetical protein